MQQFNIDRYFNLLRMKGYEVKPRYDKQRKLVGYTVGKNTSVFKASEIGRKYMVSKIEDTWKKLHPQPREVYSMFTNEQKKVRERYKEYDGCYLGHFAQWFFWFFFTIGIFVVVGAVRMMIAQSYGK